MREGSLIIAGGGIDQGREAIFSKFIQASGGPGARILVVVTASGSEPDDTFSYIAKGLEGFGLLPGQCTLLPLYEKSYVDLKGQNLLHGDAEGILDYLRGITGVWFTGGDQYFIWQGFVRQDGSDTRLLAQMRRMHQQEGLCIGGSSAGAAIMSQTMICEGSNRGLLHRETLFDYDTYDQLCAQEEPFAPLILSQGLGFFAGGVVDQHVDARPRLLRLIEACFVNPRGQRLGFGVSEDTALIYEDGVVSVLGQGCVYLADCLHAVRHQKGDYQGVLLSALQAGDQYIPATKQVRLAKEGQPGETRFARDYVCGGIQNQAIHDGMIIDGLLFAREERLYSCPGCGQNAVLACTAHEAAGSSYFVSLYYGKTEQSRGYLGPLAKASYTGISLCTRAISFATWTAPEA